jgi:phage terminase small subunit
MGRRGPAPQPTKLKLLRGNPGKRALNDREPEPEPLASSECPAHLKGDARSLWNSIVKPLVACAVITVVDVGVAEMLCETHRERRVLEAQQRKVGIPQAITLGYHRRIMELRKLEITLRRELGATPAARSAVRTAKPKSVAKDEDEERTFGRRRKA